MDELTLNLVVHRGYGQAEEQAIRERFTQRLGPIQLAIRVVPEIPRTERGKFRAVVSRLARKGGFDE